MLRNSALLVCLCLPWLAGCPAGSPPVGDPVIAANAGSASGSEAAVEGPQTGSGAPSGEGSTRVPAAQVLAVEGSGPGIAVDPNDALHTNRFTLALLRLLPRETNAVVSPFNVRLALGMMLSGARGTTASELAAALHVPEPASWATTAADTTRRLDALQNTDVGEGSGEIVGVTLRNATSLWLDATLPLQPAWRDTLVQELRSEPHPADFASNPESVRATINAWTSERTNAMIPNLLPPGSIQPSTRLVVVSATYFLGAWATAFSPALTQNLPFTLQDGAAISVPTMARTGQIEAHSTAERDVILLPYVGQTLSMLVVVPRQTTPMAFVDTLTAESFATLMQSPTSELISLTLPRFRVETGAFLASLLGQLGVSAALTPTADFSGIAENSGLYIEEVIHRAVIDVSESGTEAAAATAVISRSAAPRPQPRRIAVDRPFLYFVVENSTQLVLFAGQVVDPR
jgi:serpin B